MISEANRTRERNRYSLSLSAFSALLCSIAVASTLATVCRKLMSCWVNLRRLLVCAANIPNGCSSQWMIILSMDDNGHTTHYPMVVQKR